MSTTHVIELTPAGRGAVAVVLVAGPEAVGTVDECFHRADGRRLGELPANRILVGRWGSPSGEEVIVCRRSEDTVEVHCHGGVAAVRAVIERLSERGCRPMSWQDWLREAADDPIRAAAQILLADAPTARTAAVLLDQLQGALGSAIRTVLNAAARDDWSSASSVLGAILAHRDVGLHLTAPWRVVLAGQPNVGKSSLMNALVGFQRAIVCDLPGTTRDVVIATTAIDGWPIQLADTAGLRESRDEIESAGVARANAAAAEADLVLLVEDTPDSFADTNPSAKGVLRVLNKIDLLPRVPSNEKRRWDVSTSAITGIGLEELVTAIGRALVPSPPAASSAVPFTAEHIERLEAAEQAIAKRDAAAVASSLLPLVGR